MSRRLRLILVGAVLAVILVLAVGPRFALRRSVVERFLEDFFAGQVHLDSFSATLWPTPRASVTGVVLRRQGRTDIPPIVTIERADIRAHLVGLLRKPRHLQLVRVDGLVVRIPPRQSSDGAAPPEEKRNRGGGGSPLVVDRLVAENARLEILRDDPAKQASIFDLQRLEARSIATDRALTFETKLVNPKPRGLIDATGAFGPFDVRDPGTTPVSGTFTYRDVDLSTIRGIAGRLSAEGRFKGPLRRIAVSGTTRTPDFSLDVARQGVPLDTRFEAVVDGTNGNTYLNTVEARLLQTTILANGAVVDEPGPSSRAVVLQVAIENGRLEDLLRLAMPSEPPLSGALQLKASFRLPGDDRAVIDRLELRGTFGAREVLFASERVGAKIGELSARARGEPGRAPEGDVATDFGGNFQLRNATIGLRDLRFTVPGARVRLDGTFRPGSGAIDMRGTLGMAAKVSETTRGWKSVLLKVVDPLFSKGKAGSEVPIRVGGTTQKPEFGLDAGRVFKRR